MMVCFGPVYRLSHLITRISRDFYAGIYMNSSITNILMLQPDCNMMPAQVNILHCFWINDITNLARPKMTTEC